MIPDRLIAHNFRPICPGGDELCRYLESEWRAEKAFLARRGGDEEPTSIGRADEPGPDRVLRIAHKEGELVEAGLAKKLAIIGV